MLLIVQKDKISEKQNLSKYFTFFYFLSYLFAFLAIFLCLSSLGIYLCKIYQYPEYTVLKKISLFKFIERIENFIYIKWILNSFITLSLIIYHLSFSIKKESRKLIPTISTLLLIFFSSYIFKNNTLFYFIGLHYFPIVCLALFILYLIIGINIFIRKRVRLF